VRQPIDAIADLLEQHDAFFHVDAAQGYVRISTRCGIRASTSSASVATSSRAAGHRRADCSAARPAAATPRAAGIWRRPGTGIPVRHAACSPDRGVGKAAELAQAESAERQNSCCGFRDRLLAGIAALDPVINGDPALSTPHILNFSIPGLDAETAMEAWRDVVAVSNGAACSSQFYTCSHVLSAMGLPEERKAGALRLSWCHLTPEPDFARMVRAIQTCAATT